MTKDAYVDSGVKKYLVACSADRTKVREFPSLIQEGLSALFGPTFRYITELQYISFAVDIPREGPRANLFTVLPIDSAIVRIGGPLKAIHIPQDLKAPSKKQYKDTPKFLLENPRLARKLSKSFDGIHKELVSMLPALTIMLKPCRVSVCRETHTYTVSLDFK